MGKFLLPGLALLAVVGLASISPAHAQEAGGINMHRGYGTGGGYGPGNGTGGGQYANQYGNGGQYGGRGCQYDCGRWNGNGGGQYGGGQYGKGYGNGNR